MDAEDKHAVCWETSRSINCLCHGNPMESKPSVSWMDLCQLEWVARIWSRPMFSGTGSINWCVVGLWPSWLVARYLDHCKYYQMHALVLVLFISPDSAPLLMFHTTHCDVSNKLFLNKWYPQETYLQTSSTACLKYANIGSLADAE